MTNGERDRGIADGWEPDWVSASYPGYWESKLHEGEISDDIEYVCWPDYSDWRNAGRLLELAKLRLNFLGKSWIAAPYQMDGSRAIMECPLRETPIEAIRATAYAIAVASQEEAETKARREGERVMAGLTNPQSTEGCIKFCGYIKPILEQKDKHIAELEAAVRELQEGWRERLNEWKDEADERRVSDG